MDQSWGHFDQEASRFLMLSNWALVTLRSAKSGQDIFLSFCFLLLPLCYLHPLSRSHEVGSSLEQFKKPSRRELNHKEDTARLILQPPPRAGSSLEPRRPFIEQLTDFDQNTGRPSPFCPLFIDIWLIGSSRKLYYLALLKYYTCNRCTWREKNWSTTSSTSRSSNNNINLTEWSG